MRRLAISLIILIILQFFYFSYQIDQIKAKVTENAATANDRAHATVKVYLQTQEQLDMLNASVASLSANKR